MTIKEFITKFRNKGHEPELFDFSLFPKEFHVMSKQTPICKIHGAFDKQIKVNNFLVRGNCPKCKKESKQITTEQFVSVCKKIHQNSDGTPKYNYSKTVYNGSNEFLTIICPKHGEFKQLAAAHKAGKGCYQCGLESPNRYTNTSNQEIAILEDINNLIPDKKILQNTRSVIGPKELDIYIPELKLAFEFNGLYWHSEREVPNNNQLQKTEMCESKGIQLIHI